MLRLNGIGLPIPQRRKPMGSIKAPPHEPPEPSVICEQLTVWQMFLVAVAIIFVGTIALVFWPNPGGY